MSYRCGSCNVVCNHSQISVVTETRETHRGWEIAKEEKLCEDCAVARKINVPVRVATRSNGEGSTTIGDVAESTIVGSA